MFKFKGISSEDMQVVIEEEEHFIAKAARRYETIEIEGKDGALFDEQGYSYVERPIYVQCLNINKIDDILAWLDGEGEFEYKGRKTTARFYSMLEPKREACIRIIDTTFIRDPFWQKADDKFEKVKDRKDVEVEGQTIHIEDSSDLGANVSVKGNCYQEIVEAEEGKEVEGESVHIEDVDITKEASISILGNCKQETSEQGYNVIKNVAISTTVAGIKYTVNDDGSVTLNGATTDRTSYLTLTNEDNNLNSYQNEIFKIGNDFYIKPTEVAGVGIHFRATDGTYPNGQNLKNKSIGLAYIEVSANTTLNNVTVYPMLILGSTEEKPYEPFVPNKPSIEYESPVQCVGDNINICNAPYTESNKLTLTANKDDYFIISNDYFAHLIKGHTYTASYESDGIAKGSSSEGIDSVEFWLLKDKQHNTMIPLYDLKTKTFICEETGDYYLRFDVNKNGATHSFWNIKVEEGTVATSYSPPNQGSVAVTKSNKNWFNAKEFLKSQIESGLISIDEKGRIILNGEITTKNMWFYMKLKKGTYFCNESTNTLHAFWTGADSFFDRSTIITFNEDTEIRGYISVRTYNNQILEPIIYEGNIVDKNAIYEPHQSETKILPIQKEMCKIEDYEDDFIKQNGKWYERHFICKNIIKGNENWRLYSNPRRFGLNLSNMIPKITSSGFMTSLCNYLETKNDINTDLTAFVQGSSPKDCFLGIVDLNLRWNDVEALKTELSQKYEDGKPLYYIYVLEEPELIECTEEQSKILDELENTNLYEGITNIFTDSIANVKAHYNFITSMPSADKKSDIQTVGQNVNLCNAPYTEENKLTLTANKDDYYIISEYFAHLIKDKTYTVSLETDGVMTRLTGSGGGTDTVELYLAKDKQYTNAVLLQTSKTKTFICEETGDYYLRFDVNKNGATHSFWNIKVEEGSIATPYSPPNQGSVAITKANKNLIKSVQASSNATPYLVALYIDADIKPNTNYMVSGKATPNNTYYLEPQDESIVAEYTRAVIPFNGKLLFSFKTKAVFTGKEKYSQGYRILKNETSNKENVFEDLQLEEGSVATEYVEHAEETKNLPIQKPMCKIGDYADDFIKQSGKWYERHFIKKRVLTSEDNSILREALINNTDKTRFYIMVDDCIIGNNVKNLIYCNYYKYNNDSGQNSPTIHLAGNLAWIWLRDDNFNTLEDLKTKLDELNEAGKPFTVYYVLAEPELIECTEEQSKILDELENWSTYKNVTNMYNDSIAILKVNYLSETNEKILNLGNVVSVPIIKLTKTNYDKVELAINDVRFIYNFKDDENVEMDCKEKTIKYNNLNRNRQIEIGYEFPKLKPKENNEIKFYSGDCIVEILRKDMWL